MSKEKNITHLVNYDDIVAGWNNWLAANTENKVSSIDTAYEIGLIDAYSYIKYIPELPSTIRKTMFANADTIEEVLRYYSINDIIAKIKEYIKWDVKDEKEIKKNGKLQTRSNECK